MHSLGGSATEMKPCAKRGKSRLTTQQEWQNAQKAGRARRLAEGLNVFGLRQRSRIAALRCFRWRSAACHMDGSVLYRAGNTEYRPKQQVTDIHR